MSKKIGEVLIGKGLITCDQLEVALKAQLIYGGHIGTCLIELGLIDEDTLGQTLSEITGAPYAPRGALQEVPPAAIRVLSRKFAEEYQAVPLKLTGRTVHLAMVNPRNLHALDEISFASGHRVVPWVSPEIRIFEALETYYGVPRRTRYITRCLILDGLEKGREGQSSTRPAPPDPPRSSAEMAETSPADAVRAGRAMREGCVGATPPVDLGEDFGYGRSWREIAEQIENAGATADEAMRADHRGAHAKKLQHPSTLAEAAALLCSVRDSREAADLVLDFAATRMKRALLLGVQGETATILDSRGGPSDPRGRARAAFHVTTEPLFELVPGDGFFRGSLPAGERYSGFFHTLGMEAPSEVLIAPVHINDRLVALFYGDGGVGGSIAGATDEYLRLLRIFGMSLKLVLLKQKMLAAADFRAEQNRSESADPSAPAD